MKTSGIRSVTTLTDHSLENFMSVMATKSYQMEMIKNEKETRKRMYHQSLRGYTINSGQYDIQPMIGGSITVGGGRILGVKEDYEVNDECKNDVQEGEIACGKIIVILWEEEGVNTSKL